MTLITLGVGRWGNTLIGALVGHFVSVNMRTCALNNLSATFYVQRAYMHAQKIAEVVCKNYGNKSSETISNIHIVVELSRSLK